MQELIAELIAAMHEERVLRAAAIEARRQAAVVEEMRTAACSRASELQKQLLAELRRAAGYAPDQVSDLACFD